MQLRLQWTLRKNAATIITMTDALLEAVASLRQKRAEYVAAHKAKIAQIDSAIAAISELIEEPPPSKPNGTPLPLDFDAAIQRRLARPDGMRSKVVALAEEKNRDWSVREIINAYKDRGQPFEGAFEQIDRAMRAAIVHAVRKGQLVKTKPGRYKAAVYASPAELREAGQGVVK